jgi:hypothetical protein
MVNRKNTPKIQVWGKNCKPRKQILPFSLADFLQCPLSTSNTGKIFQEMSLVFHGHKFFSVGVSERILNKISRRSRQKLCNYFFNTNPHRKCCKYLLFTYPGLQIYVYHPLTCLGMYSSCEHWQPTGKLCKNSHGSQLELVHIPEKSQLLRYANSYSGGCVLYPSPPPLLLVI